MSQMVNVGDNQTLVFSTFSSFPASVPVGTLAEAQDTKIVYLFDKIWNLLNNGATPGSVTSVGFTNQNNVTGVVSNPTTTPTLALAPTGSTPVASGFASLDAFKNLYANNLIPGNVSFSTSQTLTSGSAGTIYMTGSTASLSITMPVVSAYPIIGAMTMFMNMSTQTWNINSSGGNLIVALPSMAMVYVQCQLITGTTAASWNAMPITYGNTTGTGNMVLADGGVIGANAIASVQGYRPINSQSGNTYTLALSDAGRMVTLNNTASVALTVPTNASVAFVVGTEIDLVQLNIGKVTVAAAGGVTINSLNGVLGFAGQYAGATLKQTAANTWLLVGAIVA